MSPSDVPDPRTAVREFLVSRRARLSPERAGVTLYGGRRRVPGLRREEVAMLAGVSTDYYVRLEKGNVTGVSDAVLNAVAGALQFDEAERLHLFNLARAARPGRTVGPKTTRRRPAEPRESLQWMLDAITGGPAVVVNTSQDLAAANALGRAFYSPVIEAAAESGQTPNFARFAFFEERSHDFYPNWDGAANVAVAQLRMAAGQDPANTQISNLVGELATRSEEFRQRWAAHNVRLHQAGLKQFRHPVAGFMEVAYNTIELPADPGHAMTVYTAQPGSPAADALQILASWAATQSGTRSGLSAQPAAPRIIPREP
jgi:transcriptional regulator with XRE-family HTH domain